MLLLLCTQTAKYEKLQKATNSKEPKTKQNKKGAISFRFVHILRPVDIYLCFSNLADTKGIAKYKEYQVNFQFAPVQDDRPSLQVWSMFPDANFSLFQDCLNNTFTLNRTTFR